MAGRTAGLIPAAGVPLLRLLAEESGLRAVLSKALQGKDFHPVHDRGQVVTDVAVALAHGATNVAAAAGVLGHAELVCGPAASAATVWRVFDDLDGSALARVAAARAAQRRKVWAALAARPEGFPWLEVAGHTWDGWIVMDVDASLIESHSDKQGAEATFKKHTAPRGALSYSQFSWEEFGGNIPGSNGLLGPERASGDNSMPMKQRPCPGTRNGVL
jgi:hypothetical protein